MRSPKNSLHFPEKYAILISYESLHRVTEVTEDLGVSQEALERRDPQGPRWAGHI